MVNIDVERGGIGIVRLVAVKWPLWTAKCARTVRVVTVALSGPT
jgi:hypothetical protein